MQPWIAKRCAHCRHRSRIAIARSRRRLGTLGVDKHAPVGFRAIRLRFELDVQADDDQLARMLELTERYCVVLQTITDGTPMQTTLARTASRPSA